MQNFEVGKSPKSSFKIQSLKISVKSNENITLQKKILLNGCVDKQISQNKGIVDSPFPDFFFASAFFTKLSVHTGTDGGGVKFITKSSSITCPIITQT